MSQALARAWYDGSRWPALLLPLAWLYWGVIAMRRRLYRRGWLAAWRAPVPVLVVGNITVGGTGKTPIVAWIVERLVSAGSRPGVISRGYGGAGGAPRLVPPDGDPAAFGDEPVLLARRTGCPVAVSPDRPAAARHLLREDVDFIVADDGLQHYALGRDAEIAVRDAARGYGNGLLLPAGPLREPLSRLREVDLELALGEGGDFQLAPGRVRPVTGDAEPIPLSGLAGRRVHAVAGIGHPERFFDTLRSAGLAPRTRAFADHHAFRREDIDYDDADIVLMTEKDAVKCRPFADARHWFVPVTAIVTAASTARVDAILARLREGA